MYGENDNHGQEVVVLWNPLCSFCRVSNRVSIFSGLFTLSRRKFCYANKGLILHYLIAPLQVFWDPI